MQFLSLLINNIGVFFARESVREKDIFDYFVLSMGLINGNKINSSCNSKLKRKLDIHCTKEVIWNKYKHPGDEY